MPGRNSLKTITATTALSLFLFSELTYSQTDHSGSIFILKGNTKLLSGKTIEDVEMELKKDGKTISTVKSGKGGKFSIQMEVSNTIQNNEYLLVISKPGTVPKNLSINTYIPPIEFTKHPFVRYDFELEVVMMETSAKDIVLERPSGKIRWDNEQNKFAFDQVYAKIAQKDEDKYKDEKYLLELAEKKRKEEEAAAKKIAEEEARKKALAEAKRRSEEEALKLAEQKTREESERILNENLEAMKKEMLKKRRQDSLDSIATLLTMKTSVEIRRMAIPVSPANVDQTAFNAADAFLLNNAKKDLKENKEKFNRIKARNLSAKYETNNTLTSLLNVVDDFDKRPKSKVLSPKQ